MHRPGVTAVVVHVVDVDFVEPGGFNSAETREEWLKVRLVVHDREIDARIHSPPKYCGDSIFHLLNSSDRISTVDKNGFHLPVRNRSKVYIRSAIFK